MLKGWEEIVVIESVKAASDIMAPIDGEIVEVNEALVDGPTEVNEDPLGNGWIFKIKVADASDMENMSPKEVNTDMMANAADSMFTALAWNAGAATLTPVITKGLGKVGRLMIGAKSKDAKELVNIARDKGLPLPMVMTAQEGTGLLGGFAAKYFKVLGIMPFINGIGKEALQGAEQAAGKNYLNNDLFC